MWNPSISNHLCHQSGSHEKANWSGYYLARGKIIWINHRKNAACSCFQDNHLCNLRRLKQNIWWGAGAIKKELNPRYVFRPPISLLVWLCSVCFILSYWKPKVYFSVCFECSAYFTDSYSWLSCALHLPFVCMCLDVAHVEVLEGIVELCLAIFVPFLLMPWDYFGGIFLASSCQCGLEGSRRIVGGEESMVIVIIILITIIRKS